MSTDSGPVPIRKGLEQLMAGLGAPEIDASTAIVDSWPEIVGPELAKGVVAVAVRGRELIVRVDDPAWASQVAWLEAPVARPDQQPRGSGPGHVCEG